MLNIENLNNKIVIIKDQMKKSLLNIINDSSKLYNIKIITLSELKNKYCFSYDKKAIFYICNKYNVINDIAKIYIDSIYYINKEVKNDKVSFLNDLKNDLLENNLIYENKIFKSFLKNKDIVLLDLEYVDKFYKNIFKELDKNNNIEEISINIDNGIKPIYKAKTIDDEVLFVANNICKLIKSGININNIKLSNISSEYYYSINKIFKLFNINVELNNTNSISGSKLVKLFKENYSNSFDETIKLIENNIVSENDRIIYKQIINILNQYSFIDNKLEIKDLVFSDLDSIKVQNNKYKNAVRIVDIDSEIISDDDYVFLLNFNEGVIPINHKDEDYLSDSIKKELNISTSYDLNKDSINSLRKSIRRVKNLIVSYITYNMNNEVYISSIYDESLFEEKEIENDYLNSDKYNKIILLKRKDEYNKYGVISDELLVLNNHYKDYEYLNFDNKYKLIDKESLLDYLKKGLTLSYSSINNYYECSFKYYLSNILRIDKYEDSFEIIIGNIFHKILSECFNSNYDFDNGWKEEVNKYSSGFTKSELFFVNKLKNELLLIIDTIKNQLNYTQLKKSMYEKEIIVELNKDLHIIFKGYIDKVLYDEFDDNVIVAIIDYKTGNPKININNIIYGLDMQLPVYIYLLKNSEFKNVKVGGFYLQKILNNYKTEEDRINNLKLQGYSNSDEDILRYVDSSYRDSKVIKSLKMSNNGFYQYSKVMSDSNIDKLYSIVSNNIDNAYKNIISAHFDINPKEINGNNVSCTYCKYKDICYMKNEDIVKLKQETNLFGGEDDD